MLRRVVVCLVMLAACGPSAQLVKKADQSAYHTEYPTVWNSILSAVRAEYPGLAVVDAVHGTIITKWKLIERDTSGSMSASGKEESLAGQRGELLQPGRYFRLAVYVKSGPPWVIEVDGEAMQYVTGMAMVTPWDHGDVDEPVWVKTRIDKIKVSIYQRLEAYARPHGVEAAPARPGTVDLGPWKNLGPEASAFVGSIYGAARKKDVDALRKLMIEDFTWSNGGEPSADTAVSMWRADPLNLAALVRTLEAGCSERETELIVCPARGGGTPGSYRVEIRNVDGAWRFTMFMRED
jgi:hypothetical protein